MYSSTWQTLCSIPIDMSILMGWHQKTRSVTNLVLIHILNFGKSLKITFIGKNLCAKTFLFWSFISAVHWNHVSLWAVTAIHLQIPQAHSKQLFLKKIIQVDICIAMASWSVLKVSKANQQLVFLQPSAEGSNAALVLKTVALTQTHICFYMYAWRQKKCSENIISERLEYLVNHYVE